MKRINKLLITSFSFLIGIVLSGCNENPSDSTSTFDSSTPSNSMIVESSSSSEVSDSSTSSSLEENSSSSSEEIHTEHDFKLDSVVKDPTCSEVGEALYKCVCGETQIVNVPALGHSMEYHSLVEAKCEVEGQVEYYHCTRCEKNYSDESGENLLEELTISALGHDYVESIEKEASCSEPGIKKFVCSHDETHTYTEEIPQLNHEITFVNQEDATCMTTGVKEHYECSNCHKMYSDENGTNELTAQDVLIPLKEHEYVVSVSTFNFNGDVTYEMSCKHCHTIVNSVQAVGTPNAIVALNANTISNAFIENTTTSTTCFVSDENGVWKNNNQNQSSTTAYMNLNIKVPGTLEFDVEFDTEAKWDKFIFDGENYSGKGKVHLSKTFDESSSITLQYSKDSSGNSGTDTVTLSNMRFIVDGSTDISELTDSFTYNLLTLDSMGGEIENSSYVYIDNTAFTLPIPTHESKVFVGWYKENTYETLVNEFTTLTGKMTLFAKWGEKVVVTLINDEEVTTMDIISGSVVDLPVLSKSGYLFDGWYSSSTFLPESLYNGEVITENTTFYAHYVNLPSYVGSYKGFNFYGSSGNGSSSANKTALIGEDFTFTTNSTNRGIITAYDSITHEAVVSDGDKEKPILIYEEYGVVVANNSASSTSNALTDFDFYVLTSETVTCDAQVVWNSGKNRVIKVTYGDQTLVFYVDSNSHQVFFDVIFTTLEGDSLSIEDIYSNQAYCNSLVISNESGKIAEFAKSGNSFVALDGAQGTYNGNLGVITIDGTGTLFVEDSTEGISYIKNGNVIQFTLNDSTKTITLLNDIYEIYMDSTLGTYSGELGEFISNGDGTATLNGVVGVYKIAGTVIVFTSNANSVSFVLNNDGTYITNNIFAGHTFVGSYYNNFDEETSSLKIIFNDGSVISGTIYPMYSTYYPFEFEAVLDGNTLTMTITSAIDSSAVGKVIVATVEGGTITIVSCGISNSAYSFANNGSATDNTFSL